MKFDVFSELTAEFRRNGIPTYTEIIMGLPGETLKTFKHGLENIAHTKIDTVFIYHCSVLPNAPMNVPEYRKKYGIKTVKSPIMLVHSSVHNRGIQEFEDLATENDTCSLDELKEKILESFNVIRVYTRQPGTKQDSVPVVLNPKSTLKDVAEKVLHGYSKKVKYAKITGPSSKFTGQKVGLKHIVKDRDVVEFFTE